MYIFFFKCHPDVSGRHVRNIKSNLKPNRIEEFIYSLSENFMSIKTKSLLKVNALNNCS